ncbi:MAG TPA: hypothetical protein VF458_10705 [Ktedonobacteraceae bacterium]
MATREQIGQSAPGAFSERRRVAGRPNLQRVVFAVMLTLGFLGMAIFFTFFYAEDANHYLYGAAMGLTALGWLALATRRWSEYRQAARV